MTVLPHFRLTGPLKRGAVIVPVLLAIALAGCANAKKPAVDPATTSSTAAQPMTPQDFDEAVKYWGDRYAADAKNKEVALNYAAALRRTDHSDQAVAVLQKTVINFPEDRDVLAAYGKALAAAGKLQQALDAVRRAQTPDKPDWKLLSAEAAILDQIGQYAQARKLYDRALDLAPNDPTVLSNYGMSYVLTGELAEAERLLRKAIAAPGADSRVRQNLALVVGLEGRFAEAEKIASEELSPEQAAANIAYLKQMLAEHDSWQQLQAGPAPKG
jgi:Flp pilus assembly protein TadD